MRSIYRYVASLAGAMGYYVGKLPPPTDRLQSHLNVVLRAFDVNCVLDVGAHHGEYAKLLREVGYKGRIVSFEPVSENYRELQKAAEPDPDWITHPIAVGNRDGDAEIHVTGGTVCASFLEPSDYGRGQLGTKLAVKTKEQVQVRRLDTLFGDCVASIEDPRVYLKSDAQGFDLQVLEGAGQILRHVAALQLEVSVRSIYRQAPTMLDVIPKLHDLGFELSGLFPVALDRDLRLMEMDSIFVSARPWT